MNGLPAVVIGNLARYLLNPFLDLLGADDLTKRFDSTA